MWDWTETHALHRIDHHAGYYLGISTNSAMHAQILGGKLISGVPFIMYHPEELQPSVCTVYSVHERSFDTFEALPNENLNSYYSNHPHTHVPQGMHVVCDEQIC